MEGTVFETVPQALADITTTDGANYMFVSVSVGATEVIKFPMPLGSDENAVMVRTTNIINQSGLVANPVTVEMVIP